MKVRLISVALSVIIVVIMCVRVMSQQKTFKDQAIEQFQKANYPAAIEHLQKALAEHPNDAEIYYYLGYYTHYLSYDSVPLSGFGRAKSDEILSYLKRAVELDPHHGNAYYFIGAEYGARARDKMKRNDPKGVVEEFKLGKQAKGYPDWMIEFGRNVLHSCGQNAILFTGGDAGTNAIQYLQCVEDYRTDVTAIPFALLDRPWFVAMLKEGLTGILEPVRISWSDEQIMSMHPYKWKKNTLSINVPENARETYQSQQTVVEWELSPNLGLGEEPGLLSAGRAAFADILLSNEWERPIHFSVECPQGLWKELESNVQLYGMTYRLLPYTVQVRVDIDATSELLLDENNYRSLPTLSDADMPRVSNMLQNYRVCFLHVVYQLIEQDELERANAVFEVMNRVIPEDVLPSPEQYRNIIEAVRQKLEESG